MTPLQLKLLGYLRDRLERFETAPTYEEIATELGCGKSQAWRLVDALIASGHLVRGAERQRGLRLADAPDLRGVGTETLRAELARRGLTLDALIERPRPIASGIAVTCAADSCGRTVERGRLFCRPHWFALAPDLREDIIQAHRRRDIEAYQAFVAEARDVADGGRGRRA